MKYSFFMLSMFTSLYAYSYEQVEACVRFAKPGYNAYTALQEILDPRPNKINSDGLYSNNNWTVGYGFSGVLLGHAEMKKIDPQNHYLDGTYLVALWKDGQDSVSIFHLKGVNRKLSTSFVISSDDFQIVAVKRGSSDCYKDIPTEYIN